MLKSTTLMPLISLNPATTEIKLQIHFVRTLPPLEKFISPLEMPPLPAGMQGLLLARESLCAAFTSFYWEVTSIVLLLCVHQVQIYDWYMVEIELNSYTVKQMVLYFCISSSIWSNLIWIQLYCYLVVTIQLIGIFLLSVCVYSVCIGKSLGLLICFYFVCQVTKSICSLNLVVVVGFKLFNGMRVLLLRIVMTYLYHLDLFMKFSNRLTIMWKKLPDIEVIH